MHALILSRAHTEIISISVHFTNLHTPLGRKHYTYKVELHVTIQLARKRLREIALVSPFHSHLDTQMSEIAPAIHSVMLSPT